MANKTEHKRILVVGPAWIGDMVMSQSLYRLLRQQQPDVSIDVLAPEWTHSLLERMPEVANAIPSSLEHGELALGKRMQLAKALRQHQYDQAIVLQNSLKSALIPWLARIPHRTGWRGEYRYGLLNDIRVLDKKTYPLMVQQFAALALPAKQTLPDPVPYPLLKVSTATQQQVIERFQLKLTAGRPILGLSPGAAFGPSKRWPSNYFAELAKQKLNDGWDVWLFGAAADQPLIDDIMQVTDQRCVSFAGKTKLAETIDLVSLTSGVVTNDSGLMHIAAALDKPLIAIYGSTSPGFTPPLGTRATILQLNLDCQPCFARDCPLGHHRCMQDIKPAQVLQALQQWGVG